MKSPPLPLPLPPVLHILLLHKKLFHFIECVHYTQREYKSFNWIEYIKYIFKVKREEDEKEGGKRTNIERERKMIQIYLKI